MKDKFVGWTTPVPPPKGVLHRIDNDLEYYPSTGDIVWVNPGGHRVIKSGDIAGTLMKSGYILIRLRVNSKVYSIYAHHIAYYKMHGVWPPKEIDHKRGKKSDNRWRKLRLAKHYQNGANSKLGINNTTGISGVSWYKSSNKYRVRIKYKYKEIHVGYFDTLREAKRARRRAERQYFGKFRFRG
jgi:HNH endonuclease/AP2 domain